MLPRVTSCALIVLCSAICLTAQSPARVAIWAPTALSPSLFLRLRLRDALKGVPYQLRPATNFVRLKPDTTTVLWSLR
jgi:hypothetical protein